MKAILYVLWACWIYQPLEVLGRTCSKFLRVSLVWSVAIVLVVEPWGIVGLRNNNTFPFSMTYISWYDLDCRLIACILVGSVARRLGCHDRNEVAVSFHSYITRDKASLTASDNTRLRYDWIVFIRAFIRAKVWAETVSCDLLWRLTHACIDKRLVRGLCTDHMLRRTLAHGVEAVEHSLVPPIIGDKRTVQWMLVVLINRDQACVTTYSQRFSAYFCQCLRGWSSWPLLRFFNKTHSFSQEIWRSHMIW